MDPAHNAYTLPECHEFFALLNQFNTDLPKDIQFYHQPLDYPSVRYERQTQFLYPNSEQNFFRLNPANNDSKLVMHAQELGAKILHQGQNLPDSLLKEVLGHLAKIDQFKMVCWNSLQASFRSLPGVFIFSTKSIPSNHNPGVEERTLCNLGLIPTMCVLSPLFHKEFNNLSNPNAQLLYDTAKLIAIEALEVPDDTREEVRSSILALPDTVKALPNFLGIANESGNLEYIMCPTCFALYHRTTRQPIREPYVKHSSALRSIPILPSASSVQVCNDGEDIRDEDMMDDMDEEIDEEETDDEDKREEDEEDEEVWDDAAKFPHYGCATEGLCTYQYTPSSRPCGAQLFNIPKTQLNQGSPTAAPSPVKIYTVPGIEEFLRRVLRTPGVELAIKEFTSSSNTAINDIFFSPYIQNLRELNGNPFVKCDKSQMNICFGLYLDWFGPRGNRMGASHYSTGVLYLTILNLPPHMRYNRDYLFPVFIPGPQEPTTDGLNHLLAPIVSQLNILFYKGFFIRQEQSSSDSWRKIRAMLAIIVADAPAACKCGGYAAHSHRWFCHHCRLQRSSIDSTKTSSWEQVSRQAHLKIIESWRDAVSVNERKRIFDQWGFRWTELARLEYLDLTKCFVIDPMHTILLGVIQNHVRHIFGLTGRVEPGASKHPSDPTSRRIFYEERRRGEEILSRLYLNAKLLDILLSFHFDTLEFLCQQRDINFLDVPLRNGKPKKLEMVASLGNWVSFCVYVILELIIPVIIRSNARDPQSISRVLIAVQFAPLLRTIWS
jgi:hypothetical protein